MKKIIKHTLPLLLLLITVSGLKAQNNAHLSDTSVVAQLASDLLISKQKALRLHQVLNHSLAAEVSSINSNKKIPVIERQMMVKKLLMARHYKIDSLLTPAQKALLMQHESAALQQSAAELAAVRQRHEQEMNQAPHQILRQSTSNGDTTKKKNSGSR